MPFFYLSNHVQTKIYIVVVIKRGVKLYFTPLFIIFAKNILAMYDITLCVGGECPLKNQCLRYTLPVLGRQDFFGAMPYDVEKKTCEHFYPLPVDEKDETT